MAAYRRVYDSRHLQADCKNLLLFSFHGSRRQRTSPADPCCTLRLVGRVYDRRYVPDQVKVKVNGV